MIKLGALGAAGAVAVGTQASRIENAIPRPKKPAFVNVNNIPPGGFAIPAGRINIPPQPPTLPPGTNPNPPSDNSNKQVATVSTRSAGRAGGSFTPAQVRQRKNNAGFLAKMASGITTAERAINASIQAKNMYDQFRNATNSSSGNTGGGKPMGKRGRSSSIGAGDYTFYGTNRGNPETVDVSSGVPTGLITNPGEKYNSDDYSQLFGLSGMLFSAGNLNKDTAFNNVLSNYIYPYVSREIQNNLNYAYFMLEGRFKDYIYSLSAALQIYYMLNKIIVYTNNTNNRNEAMQYLRTKITSEIRLRYNALEQYLTTLPIPPNMLKLVRFMYQNFTQSSVNYSPEYTLIYGNMFNDKAPELTVVDLANINDLLYSYKLSVNLIDQAIANIKLYDYDVNKIYQAMPQWRVSGGVMPGLSDRPVYSEKFNTFWFNSCIAYDGYVGSTTKYTVSGALTAGFRYWLFEDWQDMDGIVYALSSFFLTTDNTVCRPGLWTPCNAFGEIAAADKEYANSAYSYDVSSNVKAFRPIYFKTGDSNKLRRMHAFNNQETVYYNKVTSVFATVAQADPRGMVAQEATFQTFKQCVYHVAEWIFAS
jgi:hypothetical protein